MFLKKKISLHREKFSQKKGKHGKVNWLYLWDLILEFFFFRYSGGRSIIVCVCVKLLKLS